MSMISLDEATKDWQTYGIWKIAPAGLSWIKEGARSSIGARAIIGEGSSIGEWASIGARAIIGARSSIGEKSSEAIDLGWADGYRKCIAQVDGVAYIGAGCRWFTLANALNHWENHSQDRTMTMCLLMAAISIAEVKGWSQS